MPKFSLKFSIGLAIILLGLAHLWHGQYRYADPDEFQFLVNACTAADGLRPYVHYWDNHGPLNIWILQPAFMLWDGGHELIRWLRILPWINTLVICGLMAWLMRRVYPDRSLAPWVAVLFLLVAPPYLYKGLEIRGDNLANLLGTICLFGTIIGIIERRPWLFLMVGIGLGLIAGITLKVLTIGAGIGLVGLILCGIRRTNPGMKSLMLGGIGFLFTAGVIWLVLYGLHLDEAFLLCYFKGNVSRENAGFISSEISGVLGKAAVWSLLALGTMIGSGWRVITGRADAVEAALLGVVVFTLGQFLLLLPTQNMQSLLPIYVPLAILAGLAGEQILACTRWRGLGFAIAAVVVAMGLGYGIWRYCELGNRQLPKQVAFADEVLKRTASEKYIFDPTGVVFLKPRPKPFPVLVTFIRDLLRSRLDLPGMLESFQVRSVIYDKRVEDLAEKDKAFVRLHFSPVVQGPQCLLVQQNADPAMVVKLDPDKEISRWWLHGRPGKNDHAPPTGDGAWLDDYFRQLEKPRR